MRCTDLTIFNRVNIADSQKIEVQKLKKQRAKDKGHRAWRIGYRKKVEAGKLEARMPRLLLAG